MLLSDDTGSFDALYQVSLTEQIYDDERIQDQQSAGVADGGLVKRLAGVIRVERFRNRNDVRHQLWSGRRKERIDVEVVGPLPREREQEHSYHHRYRDRHDYAEKRFYRAVAVDVRRFL